LIVDTHTHVISDDLETYPLSPAGLPGAWYREAPHTAPMLLEGMDAAGVERAVLVQGVGAYSYDNRYAADAAARYPDRFWSACAVDVDGDDPVAELDHWVGDRGMHGVRMFALSRDDTSWLDDPRTFPLWERAAELGAHVIVTILYHQIPKLRSVLRQFPDTEVSLDHCAFPPLTRAPWTEARALFELAEHPNLYLKVSTNVLDAVREAGSDPAQGVEALVDRFGGSRLMWGSDFCQTHDRSYSELVEFGRAAFAGLAPLDRDRCLGGTAAELWRRRR
jgi:predicted TIM-barrel fold metal-dependent hydrolase